MKHRKTRRKVAQHPHVEVVATDLRALLFWASVGVRASRGGQYEDDIEAIIQSYQEFLKLPRTPAARFKKGRP